MTSGSSWSCSSGSTRSTSSRCTARLGCSCLSPGTSLLATPTHKVTTLHCQFVTEKTADSPAALQDEKTKAMATTRAANSRTLVPNFTRSAMAKRCDRERLLDLLLLILLFWIWCGYALLDRSGLYRDQIEKDWWCLDWYLNHVWMQTGSSGCHLSVTSSSKDQFWLLIKEISSIVNNWLFHWLWYWALCQPSGPMICKAILH